MTIEIGLLPNKKIITTVQFFLTLVLSSSSSMLLQLLIHTQPLPSNRNLEIETLVNPENMILVYGCLNCDH